MSRRAIIVFIKNPVAGKVKTRLAAEIGEHKALEAYQTLLQYTFEIVEQLEVDIFVYSNEPVPDSFHKPGKSTVRIQHGKTLGDRMFNAFTEVFETGYQSCIIIGSDCPELTPETIETAFQLLDVTDVVIGPANDGGYYLLGMKTVHGKLFHGKKWSTGTVLNDTIADFRVLNLDYSQLPVLSDLDTFEDYKQFPDFWV